MLWDPCGFAKEGKSLQHILRQQQRWGGGNLPFHSPMNKGTSFPIEMHRGIEEVSTYSVEGKRTFFACQQQHWMLCNEVVNQKGSEHQKDPQIYSPI